MPETVPARPIRALVANVALLLPLWLYVWYALAAVLNWPLAQLADFGLPALLPNLIAGIEPDSRAFKVIAYPNGIPQPLAQVHRLLVFHVDPLLYTFGLPLFTALTLAVPDREWHKWRRWLLGLPVLLLAALWGVCFDILSRLAFGIGLGGLHPLHLPQLWQRDLLALAWQLGNLILPSVLPVALWALLNRAYLRTLLAPDLTRLCTH